MIMIELAPQKRWLTPDLSSCQNGSQASECRSYAMLVMSWKLKDFCAMLQVVCATVTNNNQDNTGVCHIWCIKALNLSLAQPAHICQALKLNSCKASGRTFTANKTTCHSWLITTAWATLLKCTKSSIRIESDRTLFSFAQPLQWDKAGNVSSHPAGTALQTSGSCLPSTALPDSQGLLNGGAWNYTMDSGNIMSSSDAGNKTVDCCPK